MAYDFPNSPTLGQTVTGSGSQQWQWDGVKWSALTGTYAGPPPGAIISATPPSYTAGSLWWDTNGAQLYVRYDDGTSVQWVPATNLAQLSNAATQDDVARTLNNVGRNLLHNPLFNVMQRGSGPWTTTGVYTADRWGQTQVVLDAVSFVMLGLSDADRAAIGDEAATYTLQNTFTGNAGATALSYIVQKHEKVSRLSGKTVTISFWAKCAGGTPKLGVNAYQYFGTGGSPSAGNWVVPTGTAVTLSTTWARYSVTLAIPSIAGKVVGSNGDDFHQFAFWYSSGATNNAFSGNVGVQSNVFQLWGVQLEIGNVATQLEKPDPRYDMSNCQRFYQPGQLLWAGQGTSGVTYYMSSMHSPMRALATMVITNNASASFGAPTLADNGTIFYTSAASTVTGAVSLSIVFTASADL